MEASLFLWLAFGAIVVSLGFGFAYGTLRLENTRLHEQIASLHAMATTDALTGVFTRHVYELELTRLTAHALRSGEPLALLVIDVNDLRVLNEQRGHPGADAVLRAFGRLLRDAFRPTDLVCRIGGDEFAVILADADVSGARSAALRLTGRVRSAKVRIGSEDVPFTVSIGGGAVEIKGEKVLLSGRSIGLVKDPAAVRAVPEALYRRADENLTAAKKLKEQEAIPSVIR